MPLGAVKVTFTVPVPGRLVALMQSALTKKKLLAGVVPKSTAVTFLSPLPVIATTVPPAPGPLFGLIPVTVGAATAV